MSAGMQLSRCFVESKVAGDVCVYPEKERNTRVGVQTYGAELGPYIFCL